jgi:hypothetical protein
MSELAKTDGQPTARKNWVDDLAFEVALEYFPPEDLQLRFNLSEDQYQSITEDPRFQAKVLEHRRSIDENGTQFRVLARKLAAVNLPQLHQIANDPRANPGDRISAVKALASFGGFDKPDSGGGNTAFQVNINLGGGEDRSVTVEQSHD